MKYALALARVCLQHALLQQGHDTNTQNTGAHGHKASSSVSVRANRPRRRDVCKRRGGSHRPQQRAMCRRLWAAVRVGARIL